MPSKKTANKKQSFLSRFNLRSPKAKLIVVVASFSVIGGGIMVFNSFAATPSITFAPSEIVDKSSFLVKETITNRRGTYVVEGLINGIDTGRTPTSHKKLTAFINQYKTKPAQVCATVRATQAGNKVEVSISGVETYKANPKGITKSLPTTVSTTAYQTICTSTFYLRNEAMGAAFVYVNNHNGQPQSKIRVASIKVQIMVDNPNSDTIPTPVR